MGARDVEAGSAFVRVSLKGLKDASKRFKRWGADLQKMGLKFGAAGGALAVPVAAAVKTFADFDDAMRAVKGVTGATEKDFASLTTRAKELGASTSFTAKEVAELMVELGRAGFNPRQIEAMTDDVMNLARATGTEGATAAGIMAASLRQFNLDATQAGRAADVLAAAANKSFNTVESLGEALSYAGPVAADFGVSIEDAVAMLGVLGNVGIQGSAAGTALRRMLIISGAEADKLGKTFGTSFREADGSIMSMIDILEEMNRATADMTKEQRIKAFNEAFGLLGITGASSLTGNIGSVQELRKALQGASGTAAKTAEEMDAGLGGSFRMLSSAIEGVKIAMGEALSPILTDISSKMQSVAAATKRFIEANGGAALAIAGTALALISAGAGLISLGITFQVVAFAAAGLSAAIGLLASPLGIIAGLVAIQTAAWMKFTTSGQQAATALSEGFVAAFDAIKQTFEGVTNALKAGNLALAGEIAMTGLKLAFFKGIQPIREQWIKWNQGIVSAFANAAKSLVRLQTNLAKKLSDGWSGMRVTGRSFRDWLAGNDTESQLADLEKQRGSMTEREYLVRKAAIQEGGAQRDLDIFEQNDARAAAMDQAANDAIASIDQLAEAWTDNLGQEIADGEQRINDLSDALAGLNAEAKTAADEVERWKSGRAGIQVGGMAMPGMGFLASMTEAAMDAGEAAAAFGDELIDGRMGLRMAGAAVPGMGFMAGVAQAALTPVPEAKDTKPEDFSGGMPVAQIGTFSAAAAGAMFASRTEDAIQSTAESTREMARDMREIKRRRNTTVFA